ncbi:GtrA family protein [Streptomyces sp. AM8-1-1]|uniref:GtrA family protein n=1 Tax=Streptomyces sp. AM8-1-1 TaxID=3075825 RepID=UPI0028C4C45A|nr:GtrA family protein [Streptomyces sp. AM8-1-1]WNO72766.1 GtrA family protein [Streptomyces sp. AM8-1-1]
MKRVPWPEAASFILVGGGAYAADVALFTLLRGPGDWGPLTAKSVSFLAGCTIAYLGNAFGTYRRRSLRLREYAAFFGVNVAGAVVQLLCLAVSHHGLGLTSARADLVSGLGVGMVLATCLRFWGARTLVFRVEGRRTPWTG